MARFIAPAPSLQGMPTTYDVSGATTATHPTFDGDPLFTGQYIRIGDLVHFDIQVDMDNITDFGTGQYYVTLPFNANSNYMFREGCHHDTNGNKMYHISGHVLANENVVYLYTTDKQGNSVVDVPFSQGQPVNLTQSHNFHISGTYQANE